MKKLLTIALLLLLVTTISFCNEITLQEKTYENEYYTVEVLNNNISIYNKFLDATTTIELIERTEQLGFEDVYKCNITLPNDIVYNNGTVHVSTQTAIDGIDDYIRLDYSTRTYNSARQCFVSMSRTTVIVVDYKNVQKPFANVVWYSDYNPDGEEGYQDITFSRVPEEVNGDIIVPMVDMADKLNYQFEWNQDTGTITCSGDIGTITAQVGSPYITANSSRSTATLKSKVAVYLNNGTPMISLRDFFELSGYFVSWDEVNRTMIITGTMNSSINTHGILSDQEVLNGDRDLPLEEINITKPEKLDDVYSFRVRVGQFKDIAGNLVEDFKYGVMNEAGDVLYDADAAEAIEFYDNYGSVDKYDRETRSGSAALIDRKGQYILVDKYFDILIFDNGRLAVQTLYPKQKYSCYTKDGVKISSKYPRIGSINEDGIGIGTIGYDFMNPRYFIGDASGNVLYVNDLLELEKVTPNGQYIITYNRVDRSFNNSQKGVVDMSGNVLLPAIFEDIEHMYGDVFKIRQDANIYFVDVSKKDIFNLEEKLLLDTPYGQVKQTIEDYNTTIKIYDTEGNVQLSGPLYLHDYYDDRYVIFHEHLNDASDPYKLENKFSGEEHFYLRGAFYPVIFDFHTQQVYETPEGAGAYLGNGYFEYINWAENYFGLIHLDGRIIQPKSNVLDAYRDIKYPEKGIYY